MLVAAAILLLSAAIVQMVHRREMRHSRTRHLPSSAALPLGGPSSDAFKLVFHQKYLGLLAVFSLLFTLVKTNGDFVLAKLVSDAARNGVMGSQTSTQAVSEYIGGFYASYYLYIDILSLALQAIVVSRLVKYAGLGVAFFVLPVLAFLDAGTMSALPLLTIVGAGKVVESATDYSLNNTVRNMPWLPTTRRAKYLAKQTIDTFFVRMGDVVSAAMVFFDAQLLGLGVRTFSLCNLLLTLLWMWLAWVIVREQKKDPMSASN